MRGETRDSEIPLNLQRHTLTFLLLLGPLVAVGQQEQPGIDLTTPPDKKAGDDVPLPPPPPGTSRTKKDDAAPLAPGEGDVAMGDRVKAVQRKGFLKRHRLELGVAFPTGTINDAFYDKLGVGGKLAYNLDDSFAVALRGNYYLWQLRSSHVREGQLAFSSLLLTSQINGQAMLDGVWSPIYGKVAWLGSRIVHFDLYLLAGVGAVWSATSVAPRSEGPHIATDLGGGIRFYPKDWLSLDAGLVATLYPDQPSVSAPSTVQKVLSAQIGFTLFFPTTFEYVYP